MRRNLQNSALCHIDLAVAVVNEERDEILDLKGVSELR